MTKTLSSSSSDSCQIIEIHKTVAAAENTSSCPILLSTPPPPPPTPPQKISHFDDGGGFDEYIDFIPNRRSEGHAFPVLHPHSPMGDAANDAANFIVEVVEQQNPWDVAAATAADFSHIQSPQRHHQGQIQKQSPVAAACSNIHEEEHGFLGQYDHHKITANSNPNVVPYTRSHKSKRKYPPSSTSSSSYSNSSSSVSDGVSIPSPASLNVAQRRQKLKFSFDTRPLTRTEKEKMKMTVMTKEIEKRRVEFEKATENCRVLDIDTSVNLNHHPLTLFPIQEQATKITDGDLLLFDCQPHTKTLNPINLNLDISSNNDDDISLLMNHPYPSSHIHQNLNLNDRQEKQNSNRGNKHKSDCLHCPQPSLGPQKINFNFDISSDSDYDDDLSFLNHSKPRPFPPSRSLETQPLPNITQDDLSFPKYRQPKPSIPSATSKKTPKRVAASLQKQAELATRAANVILCPETCATEMTAHMHPIWSTTPAALAITTALEAAGASLITDFKAPQNTMHFTRTITRDFDFTNLTWIPTIPPRVDTEPYLLIHLTAAVLANLITTNTVHSFLFNCLASSCVTTPSVVVLLLEDLEGYYRKRAGLCSRVNNARLRSLLGDPPVAGRRRPADTALSEMPEKATIEGVLLAIQMERPLIRVLECGKGEAGLWVLSLVKQIALFPDRHVRSDQVMGLGFGDAKSIKSGKTAKDTWRQMLLQIPGVSERVADAVSEVYGAGGELLKVVESGGAVEALAGIATKAVVAGGRDRLVGRTVAKKIIDCLLGNEI